MSRCHAITKKGTACKARPITGTEHCLAHSDAETRISMQFVGGGPGSGRPPAPRAVDVLRERVEADIDRVLRPLWEALAADKGIMVSLGGGESTVEFIADHPVRIAAARELLDRAYGKPKQATEITGAEGGPVIGFDAKRLSDDELRQVVSIVGRGRGDSAAA